MQALLRLTAYCLLLLLAQAIGAAPILRKRDADFESVRTRLAKSFVKNSLRGSEKYFHESTFHPHYDGRFADKQLDYEERQAHLRALIQTYLSCMNGIGVETFLMHGSLLGWYWNRKIMPWDSDVDMMVSEKSIHHLADYYNMTVHHYTLPGLDAKRDYLLEVNPHYANGTLDRLNMIDARWIDTDTGLFIDITTLRPNLTAQALGQEGAMMVKDKHHYMYDDIFPLRDSTFEGAAVKIPFAYGDLLIEEYGAKALANTYFEGYRFDPAKSEWIAQKPPNFRGAPQLPASKWGNRAGGSRERYRRPPPVWMKNPNPDG